MRKLSKKLKGPIIFTFGFSLGIFVIWPGIISSNGRACFSKIIKDGSDGIVSVNTLMSISPNNLLKIQNTQNKYFKILFVGDSCFRKV